MIPQSAHVLWAASVYSVIRDVRLPSSSDRIWPSFPPLASEQPA